MRLQRCSIKASGHTYSRGLVAAAQCWAVVGSAGAVAVVRVVGVVVAASAAGSAQGGLVTVAFVVELALVFDAGQAGFDVVEFAGGDDVVRLRGHDRGDLVLGVGDAIRGLG